VGIRGSGKGRGLTKVIMLKIDIRIDEPVDRIPQVFGNEAAHSSGRTSRDQMTRHLSDVIGYDFCRVHHLGTWARGVEENLTRAR